MTERHGWMWGGVAPRWYLLVVPIAVAVFAVGDLGGFLEAPLWVPTAVITAAVPIRMLAFRRWGRDCSQRQLHYRAGVQAALVTVVIYSTGWGPMLALGYLIVAQEGIWASGSRAAWPGLVWSLVGLTAGQAALELGVAPSAVDLGMAHTIAGLAAVGGLFGVFLMQRTAVERETAEEEERQARQRLSALLEQVPDAIVVVDRDGRMELVSQAAEDVLGEPPDVLVGRFGIELVHPDDRDLVRQFFAGLLESRGRTSIVEHRVVTPSGEERWVQVSGRNLLDAPEVGGVVAVVRDVTERRRLEADRRALDKAREDFLAIAAHELRTPLGTLTGSAAFLSSNEGDLDSEEVREALHLISRQGARLEVLLSRLLEFSAAEAGALVIRPEPISVAPFVAGVAQDNPRPEEVVVRTEIEPGLTVLADPVRLEQVLTNLLVNAYRYGGPTVTVRGHTDDEWAVISVADDGPGVPEELVPHLFEPFVRGSDAESGAGVGLGLAICSRLSAVLGGELSYDTPAGGGACFSLRLRAVATPASR